MQNEYNEDASFNLFIIFIINDVPEDRPFSWLANGLSSHLVSLGQTTLMTGFVLG